MKKYLVPALVASLTLGLAPFSPHPHIWKQLKRLRYGWEMTGMDWFDLLMHGAPWVFLLIVLGSILREKLIARKQ